MEKHLFFKNRKGINLFGDLFIPEKIIKSTGIVFCPPIAEERNVTRRVCINAARYLCAYGYHVLLFDYYGEGDSEGNFEEATIPSRISDAEDARMFLHTECNLESIGLMGVRLGASIGVLLAKERINADFLILWQPVVQGYEYFYNWLRSNLASQLVLYKQVRVSRKQLLETLTKGEFIEIDGFVVTGEFSKQVMEIDLLNFSPHYTKNILVIETCGNTNKANDNIKKFVDVLRKAEKEVVHYVIEKTFDWDNMKLYDPKPVNLFIQTLSWLDSL